MTRMRWLGGVLLLGLIWWVWPSTEPPATLARLSPEAVILAFGDSLTFGTGTSPEQSYPAQLAAQTGFTVINAGVPGEVTAQGVDRLSELLLQHQPDLVILCHGGNDLLRKLDLNQTQQRLALMIERIQQEGAAVLLLAVPQPGVRLRPHPLYLELAQQYAVPIEREALAKILSRAEWRADAIHPNAEGYGYLATAIHHRLREAQAL